MKVKLTKTDTSTQLLDITLIQYYLGFQLSFNGKVLNCNTKSNKLIQSYGDNTITANSPVLTYTDPGYVYPNNSIVGIKSSAGITQYLVAFSYYQGLIQLIPIAQTTYQYWNGSAWIQVDKPTPQLPNVPYLIRSKAPSIPSNQDDPSGYYYLVAYCPNGIARGYQPVWNS